MDVEKDDEGYDDVVADVVLVVVVVGANDFSSSPSFFFSFISFFFSSLSFFFSFSSCSFPSRVSRTLLTDEVENDVVADVDDDVGMVMEVELVMDDVVVVGFVVVGDAA